MTARRGPLHPAARVPAVPGAGRGHIASFGVDRTCTAIGCGATLSRYNSGAECWSHTDQRLLSRAPIT